MKLFRYGLLLIPLFISFISFSQQTEIVKILNKELNKEARLRLKDPDLTGDTLWVITPYRIDSNVLSVTVKIKVYNDDKYYTEKQEIALDKIKAIVKDINIIFETEPDAVRIIQLPLEATSTQAAEIRFSNLFFLHLYAEKQNEALANKLIKAFGKAGLKIEKGYWYD